MIYLDNSATTRPYDAVIALMDEIYRSDFGNPSSVHRLGLRAEERVRSAREQAAAALDCQPSELYFTSGGTEADNLAIFGTVNALRRRGRRIVTTDAEHPAVLEPMKELERQGFDVVYLPTRGGRLDQAELAAAVTPDTILVSIMAVNNETGALFPVRLAKLAIERAKAPALLHTDCVQAFLKTPVSPAATGADLITLSAHKIHGPKGCGALYVRRGARIVPPYLGGGQEKGIRSGTENVAGIAGFGEAIRQFRERESENRARLQDLGRYAQDRLAAVEGVTLNLPAERAPHVLSLSVGTVRSEVVLRFLEERDIYVSAGSACASRKNSRSHVLTAMGLQPHRIDSAVRISLSHLNTREELEELAAALQACVGTLAGF